jgi:hypothetical protein
LLGTKPVKWNACVGVRIRELFNDSEHLLFLELAWQLNFGLWLEERDHSERRLLCRNYETRTSIGAELIEHAMEAHHFSIKIVEGAETDVLGDSDLVWLGTSAQQVLFLLR